MITKMAGTLIRILDDEVRLAVPPYEYAVMVSEAVRRQLQLRAGDEIALHISEYFEGNQAGSRFVPRKIGFITELELEFFELFCTVEKIGVKKALKAMNRSVRDIAEAINRQDAKWLTTLPGIGPTTAEQIVATLKRKISPFLFAPGASVEVGEVAPAKPKRGSKAAVEVAPEPTGLPSSQLLDDVNLALIGTGLPPQEARDKLDKLLQSRAAFADVGEALLLIFKKS